MLVLLNEKYSCPGVDYFVTPFGRHGAFENLADIVTEDTEMMTELAWRAVLTLLCETGSHKMWNAGKRRRATRTKLLSAFASRKNLRVWRPDGWSRSSLVIDHFDPINPEEAAKQIALLVDHLANERNPVNLASEELALF